MVLRHEDLRSNPTVLEEEPNRYPMRQHAWRHAKQNYKILNLNYVAAVIPRGGTIYLFFELRTSALMFTNEYWAQDAAAKILSSCEKLL